ncbi:MAG: o-succinylbenzoate synthase [Candidatus Omnitrophica bacterium]|nr:o-succinylbenzoate synthase [Candidatus Omnitrophota bacterium]
MQPLIITSTQVAPYKKQFQKPFTIAGRAVSYREGLILTVMANDFSGQGEIAPLEGVSPETLKKARHDLSVIEPRIKGLCVIASQKNEALPAGRQESFKRSPRPLWGLAMTQDVLDFLRNWAPLQSVCPSVRFGVEAAILDLVCHSQKITLAEFLGASLKDISTAALLQGSSEQIVQESKDYLQQGYQVFKLKVGSRNIPLDVKKVTQLREILPQDVLIRLDANRAWSLKEAELFGQLAGGDRIEFIEEPLSDMSQLALFFQKTSLPVALDETLRFLPALASQEAVKAYILKPTVLGGITATLDWIKQAKILGKQAIISSCFESGVGLKTLANLALLTDQVPGLGTGRWLGEDFEQFKLSLTT